MHRTRSLDYGIVVEGEVEAVVGEEGEGKKVERRKLGRGDVVVQRGTMHCWVNTSETEWARMMFVLMDCGKDGVEGGQDELVVLGKGESESGLGRK